MTHPCRDVCRFKWGGIYQSGFATHFEFHASFRVLGVFLLLQGAPGAGLGRGDTRERHAQAPGPRSGLLPAISVPMPSVPESLI